MFLLFKCRCAVESVKVRQPMALLCLTHRELLWEHFPVCTAFACLVSNVYVI